MTDQSMAIEDLMRRLYQAERERDAYLEELGALRADVARYRWFRARCPRIVFFRHDNGEIRLMKLEADRVVWNPDELDAAIDEALKLQPGAAVSETPA